MVDWLLQIINGVPGPIAIFLLSIAPVVELRAAIPVAIGIYQMPLYQALPIVIGGNILPAILILYGWHWCIECISKRWPWLGKLWVKWYQKTQVEWDVKIEKYGPWALALFVAIPLPGSGVWSGALAAWIFQLERKKALLSIFIGILMSTAIVTLITIGGLGLLGL